MKKKMIVLVYLGCLGGFSTLAFAAEPPANAGGSPIDNPSTVYQTQSPSGEVIQPVLVAPNNPPSVNNAGANIASTKGTNPRIAKTITRTTPTPAVLPSVPVQQPTTILYHPVNANISLQRGNNTLYASITITQLRSAPGTLRIFWNAPPHSGCYNSDSTLHYQNTQFQTQAYRTITNGPYLCAGMWQVTITTLQQEVLSKSTLWVQ